MLWLVLLLRAMFLHILLAALAAVVYFRHGADGFNPLVTDMIREMRAESIQNSLDGKPLHGPAYALLATVVMVLFLLGLRWMYLSIVRLRRWSLRILGTLVVVLSIPSCDSAPLPLPLQFALDNCIRDSTRSRSSAA